MPGEPTTDRPVDLALPTGPARVAVSAGAAVLLFGCAVGFGWTMVRFPRFRGSQPVPSWVAWSAVALCLAGLVTVVGALTYSRVATSLTAPDDAPDTAPGDGARAPSRAAATVAVFGLFAAGLAVPALAATESTARWHPVLLAAVLPVAAIAVHRWSARRR